MKPLRYALKPSTSLIMLLYGGIGGLRKHSVQDLDMAMTVAKSLVEYKKGDSSKPKPQSKGNHAKSRRDKGSRGYISKE